jgi:hypothetical protein
MMRGTHVAPMQFNNSVRGTHATIRYVAPMYNGRKLAREGQGPGHMGNLGFHAERERLLCALY